jgi:hypothetical protein
MSEKKTKITRKPVSAPTAAATTKKKPSVSKAKPAPKKASVSKAKPAAKPAAKKATKKAQAAEEAAEERGEEQEEAAEKIAAEEEAEEQPVNEQEEAAAEVQPINEEAGLMGGVGEEEQEKESYREYLTKSWFVELYTRIAAQVAEQPTLYYNISTNEEVLLDDVVELTPEEVAAVPELSDSDDPELCSDECQSIKHKLKAQGYGVYAAARLLSRPASTITQLKATIAAEENIDRFDPARHAVRTVPIKPSKSALAATGAKRAQLDLDKTFDSYNDRVTQLLLAASEDDPACVDLLTATVTCAGAKGIAELKQTRTKLASFTYPETAGYDVAQLRRLMNRYVDAYEVALREQAAPAATTTAAKPKTPASKRSAAATAGAGAVPLGKAAAKSAAGTLPQPNASTAQRTIGGAAAPLRTHAPSKIATPAVGTAPARTVVGSTSSLITTLQASKVTQRLQEQLSKAKATLKKGGKPAAPTAQSSDAKATVKSSLDRAKLAPTVSASSAQKPAASKTATIVRLPTSTKQSRVAAEEVSAPKKRGKAKAATPPPEEEEEDTEEEEEQEEIEEEEQEEEEEQQEEEEEQEEEDEEAAAEQ